MTDVNVWISGKQSRLARMALGLDLKDVAAEADLAINTISRFEQSSRHVGAAKTIRKLVDVYTKRGVEFPDTRTVRWPAEDTAAA